MLGWDKGALVVCQLCTWYEIVFVRVHHVDFKNHGSVTSRTVGGPLRSSELEQTTSYESTTCCIDAAVILDCPSLVLSWRRDWRPCSDATWGPVSTVGRLLALRGIVKLLQVLHLILRLRCLSMTNLLPLDRRLRHLSCLLTCWISWMKTGEQQLSTWTR